jgi:hypothetical protein
MWNMLPFGMMRLLLTLVREVGMTERLAVDGGITAPGAARA